MNFAIVHHNGQVIAKRVPVQNLGGCEQLLLWFLSVRLWKTTNLQFSCHAERCAMRDPMIDSGLWSPADLQWTVHNFIATHKPLKARKSRLEAVQDLLRQEALVVTNRFPLINCKREGEGIKNSESSLLLGVGLSLLPLLRVVLLLLLWLLLPHWLLLLLPRLLRLLLLLLLLLPAPALLCSCCCSSSCSRFCSCSYSGSCFCFALADALADAPAFALALTLALPPALALAVD